MKFVTLVVFATAASLAHGASPVFVHDQFVPSSPFTASAGESVDVDGELMVVGAPHANQSGGSGASDVGAVFVYRRLSSGWTQIQTIHSPQPETGAEFGASVAVEDGLLLVGEPGRSADTGGVHLLVDSPEDAAHLFAYADAGPRSVGNPSTPGARFGESLALVNRNIDGKQVFWAVVGQPDIVVSDYRVGRVLVYNVAYSIPDGVLVTVDSKDVIPATGYREQGFGRSVSIERVACVVSQCERYYIAAGAPESDAFDPDEPTHDDVVVEDRGLVRVFAFDPLDPGDADVVEFGEVQGFGRRYLIEGELDYEYLGSSVALTIANLDQPVLAVGSPYKDNGGIESAGRIGLYELRPDSSWVLGRQFVSYQDRARLGAGIAAAGATVWFSVPYADIEGLADAGQVYQATRTSGAGGDWILDGALEAAEPYDAGLAGISLAADGTNVVGGTPGAFAANVWRRGWLLTTSVDQPGAAVSGAAGKIDCPSAGGCSARIAHGERVTLIAEEGPHTIFRHWSQGACAGSTSIVCNLTMGADATVPAVFQRARLVTLYIAGSDEILTPGDLEIVSSGLPTKVCQFNCSAKVLASATVQLTAKDSATRRFAGWGGACAGVDSAVCWLSASESDASVIANYAAVEGDDTLLADGFEDD